MEFLFKGGQPSVESLKSWVTSKVSLISVPKIGNVYQISPKGYFAQFTKQDSIMTKLQITIRYSNPTSIMLRGILLLRQKEDTFALAINFPPSKEYTLISYEVALDSLEVQQAAIEITTKSQQTLNLALMEISSDIKAIADNQINTQDFAKYAILYGTDANKPKLR